MSRFRPTRASPPPRIPPSTTSAIAYTQAADLSRSPSASVPELGGLSADQVEFIDAVIDRAGRTATTFLTVFKAYNDLLQDRGLDPQNEVVLYGKLLKIGTLKGPNWGEKWKVVKELHGYDKQARPVQPRGTAAPVKTSTPVPARLTLGPRAVPKIDDDTFTLHSHDVDTQDTGTEDETEQTGSAPQYHNSRLWARRPPSVADSTTAAANSLGLDLGATPTPTPWQKPSKALEAQPVRRQPALWEPALSETTVDIAPSLSTTPPSYRAIERPRNGAVPAAHTRQATAPSRITRPPSPPLPPSKLTAAQRIAQARERRGSVLNENDAWNKIKMERDEREADRFREERLLERCWDVWRQGYQWTVTTHEQIAQARDNLILRLAIHRWHSKLIARQEVYQHVAKISDNKKLKTFMSIWKAKLQRKKKEEWRQDMRAKMKSVRERREAKLVEDAWAKWRQLYQSRLAEQHYSKQVARKFFERWASKLVEIEHLEAAADEVSEARENRGAIRVWHQWKRATELKAAERTVVERTGLRIMASTFNNWKRQMHDYHTAQEFHDAMVIKRHWRSWKTSRDRIRALERRADKHLARQDDILVRAVLRVWKAHERGKLLERVRATRLLKQTCAVWKTRVSAQRERESTAIAFATRPKSSLAVSALKTWYQVYRTHRNSQAFAVQYHSAQLTFKMLHMWRIQLRVRLKMIKQAKIAEKFFLMRRAWKHWVEKVEEQKRQKKLKLLEQRMLLQYFDRWIQRTREQRHCKLAEGYIQDLVAKRMMRDALSHWINRVVDIKDREILVSQRYHQRLLSSAFKKWKNICARHAEDFSLMESYQDVKREETIRRTFHKWLAAARASRHRRKVLQEKEAEIKRASLAAAWDKWRERFKDERLRPIEIDLLMRTQRNTLFRAFGIWHSKTRSLPAIRFHASNLKTKFWDKWRAAMPRALQARQAREKHRKAVLSAFMDKWVQKYKTKIELKAVARARYLRLPTAAPRRPQLPASTSRTAPSNPRVAPRSESPTRSEPDPSYSISAFAQNRLGRTRTRTAFASFLSSTASNPTPPPRLSEVGRPRLFARGRDVSPARTVASSDDAEDDKKTDVTGISRPLSSITGPPGEVRRTGLWTELRELQRKSRTPSDRASNPS